MKKEVLLKSISLKDDVIFFEYGNNTYYVYHETAPSGSTVTVYGWITPNGYKRSVVVCRRVDLNFYTNVSCRWFALFVKSLVKGTYKLC